MKKRLFETLHHVLKKMFREFQLFHSCDWFNLPLTKLIEKNIMKEQSSNNTLQQKVEH